MGTDLELRQSILASAKAKMQVRVLPDADAEAILHECARSFVEDPRKTWWWESPKAGLDVATVDYGDDGLHELDRLLLRSKDPLFLVATDDEPPPWLVLQGPWESLRGIIGENRNFEFFVFDPVRSRLLFDTHHNRLVLLGNWERAVSL